MSKCVCLFWRQSQLKTWPPCPSAEIFSKIHMLQVFTFGQCYQKQFFFSNCFLPFHSFEKIIFFTKDFHLQYNWSCWLFFMWKIWANVLFSFFIDNCSFSKHLKEKFVVLKREFLNVYLVLTLMIWTRQSKQDTWNKSVSQLVVFGLMRLTWNFTITTRLKNT